MGTARDPLPGGGLRAGASRALWALWMPLASRAARVGVAGPELADAARVAEGLGGRGFGVTVCFWNLPGVSPERVVESYLETIRGLASLPPGWYLSIKTPEMAYSIALAARVARAAAQAGVGIHFDSHGPEVADPTFECIAAAQATGADVGCTLPGRWQRSLLDAERVAALPLRVRVVKGQWADPEAPDLDPSSGFLSVVKRLAGRGTRVSVASHDPIVARAALETLRAAGTPCDLELLFGLPIRRAHQVAVEMGVPVRMYVPYGHGWLAHCLTQVSRNPRILWWIARDMLSRRGIPGA